MSEKIKEFTVGKYQSYYYAGASGDFNLIHIDDEYAKHAGLGGIILQGLCTMAFVYKAVIENEDPSVLKKIKVRFSNIVKPLDKLKITCKETRNLNKTKEFEVIAENQDGKLVITNGVVLIESP